MKITTNRLRQIIIEEYIKEEGLDESQAAEDLLRQLIGDEEYNRRRALDNPNSRGGDTKPMKKPNKASETMPFDTDAEPMTAAPENIEAQISSLIQGMSPEDVQDLFQAVFAKIPGVEMGPAEEEPETLYTPGAEGRPQMGFRLEELKELIREMLAENV